MSNSVSNDSSSLAVRMSEIQMGPAGGIQMLFAMLQLAQAGICKDQAEAYMDKIKDSQAKQKEAAEMIALARDLQNQAGEDGESKMTPELKAYFEDNGINAYKVELSDHEEKILASGGNMSNYDMNFWEEHFTYAGDTGRKNFQEDYNDAVNKRDSFDKEAWDYTIKSLTNYQEQLGTETQTDMVYLQDLMGQYNSFLQGANKAATDSNQTLQSILTR